MSNDHRDQPGGHIRQHRCDYCSASRAYQPSASRTKRERQSEQAEKAAEIDRASH